LDVVALCSRDVSKAAARAREFYPDAHIYSDHNELLGLESLEVVDIATHPEGRSELISDALRAGKHVLSQKPFVLDLAQAEGLIELASELGLKLAVNQNGRWAPHLAAMRALAVSGLIGEVQEIDVSIRWDHSWTIGTAFDETPHLVLFDFGVHWFDFISTVVMDREVSTVRASTDLSPGQRSPQPMRAEVRMEGPDLNVRLAFDGDSANVQRDVTIIKGADGALVSEGPDLQSQQLVLHTAGGTAVVPLSGDWFTTGFEGAMCELLCAIQDERAPTHAASDNIRSLELAFAACESANTGASVIPGAVRVLPAPRAR
jgi:predicted dehydrogenase